MFIKSDWSRTEDLAGPSLYPLAAKVPDLLADLFSDSDLDRATPWTEIADKVNAVYGPQGDSR